MTPVNARVTLPLPPNGAPPVRTWAFPGQHRLAEQLRFLQGVAHRDLKPDNMLLMNPMPKNMAGLKYESKLLSEIKIADFGFAQECGNEDNMTKCCGTPYYIAPEVLECGLYKTGGAPRDAPSSPLWWIIRKQCVVQRPDHVEVSKIKSEKKGAPPTAFEGDANVHMGQHPRPLRDSC